MTDTATQTAPIKGIGVGRGAVAGPIIRANPAPVANPNAPAPADPEAAAQKLTDTLAAVSDDLQARADAATGTLAAVLGAAAEIAADPELADQAVEKVKEGTDPALAITEVSKMFADMFTAAGGYMAERVTDLNSVRDRVVARLLGQPEPGVPGLKQPSIIVAKDLSPADTGGLDLKNVLGIVLEEGGPTSHTAIIAGQLGLPCIVRAGAAASLKDGDQIAMDAARGTVTKDPDAATLAAVEDRKKALAALAEDKSDGSTSDGHKIQLLANIGTAEDAERLTNEAVEGVGLFRTEVLFLDAQTAPTEKGQAAVYTRALNALGDRKVVVRTIDAGADKPLAFATQPNEENPALGIRAYRLKRIMPELLDTQLKAIAVAAKDSGHEPWVMAPMIATVDEAKAFADEAHAAGIKKAGVMIEIPAAAIKAKEILNNVDFVSIGSNDLAQYTMATDRLAGSLADLLDIWQPATLFLVNKTAEAGKATGKPVGVCGESASDPLMALALTGMGITSLSMAPKAVPAVRYALAHHTFAECQAIAKAALEADTAAEGRAAALALVKPEVREALVLG